MRKKNAGVTVVVINLRNPDSRPKYLFTDDISIPARNINGYLADGPNVYIPSRRKPISNVPIMQFGSMPNDGSNLILERGDYDSFQTHWPESIPLIKRFMGGE